VGAASVHIINFYTGECPTNMQVKVLSRVRSIQWIDNDMGFATAAIDGNCFFFDLQNVKENGQRNTDKDFMQKGVVFTGMCLIPNKKYECLAVGSDKKMWQSEDKINCNTPYTLS